MTNDNDLLLLASSQNNEAYKVYIDSNGYKTLTPQTRNYTAKYEKPYVCRHVGSPAQGLLVDKNPKKVRCPNCSEATGKDNNGAFTYAFKYCTSLTSVSFPSLTTATGGSGGSDSNYGAFDSAFYYCTSLTSVSFPALTTVTGGSGSSDSNYGAFSSAFNYCASLTSVSFPALTTVTASTGSDASFYDAFSECSRSLKVHFKKSMKGTAGLDYKTMSLTSADQVVFDLP